LKSLKKEPAVQHVNLTLVKQLNPSDVAVELRQHIEGSEWDEMWSFVGSKAQQRWLGYALDHKTGKMWAYVLGDRKDTAFLVPNSPGGT